MRKFNLFDKVLFALEGETEKKIGCIVGFNTDEKNGTIVDRESGMLVEPEEHSYIVLENELQFGDDPNFEIALSEYMETELEIVS